MVVMRRGAEEITATALTESPVDFAALRAGLRMTMGLVPDWLVRILKGLWGTLSGMHGVSTLAAKLWAKMPVVTKMLVAATLPCALD
eukprot:gene10228-biopygen4641